MTLTLSVPDLSAVPTWWLVLGGVLLWYFVAGLLYRKPKRTYAKSHETAWLAVWLFSPLSFAIQIVWGFVWALSSGVVPFPKASWKWD
jgi:hypothetical protein